MDPNQQQQASGASGQQEDYLDKGASVIPNPHSCCATHTRSPFFPVNQIKSLTHIFTIYTTGLDAAERKFGQGKVDPAKERGVNEKVTDQARGMFEKMTG